MNSSQVTAILETGMRLMSNRLLSKEEPELADTIETAVQQGATPEQIKTAVFAITRRRDTAQLAYYMAQDLLTL